MPLSCWTYPIHFSHGIPTVLWLLDIFQGCFLAIDKTLARPPFCFKLRSHRKIDPYLQLDELGIGWEESSPFTSRSLATLMDQTPFIPCYGGMKIQKSPSYLHTKTRRILVVLIHGDIFGSSKFGTLNSFRETIIFSIQICSFWWWECPIFTKSTKHLAQMGSGIGCSVTGNPTDWWYLQPSYSPYF